MKKENSTNKKNQYQNLLSINIPSIFEYSLRIFIVIIANTILINISKVFTFCR